MSLTGDEEPELKVGHVRRARNTTSRGYSKRTTYWARGSRSNRNQIARRTRCIVKYSRVKNSSGAKSRLSGHLDYVERKSATAANTKPLVITNGNPDSFRLFGVGEKHMHRFVISPSEFSQLDQDPFIRAVMYEFGNRAGRHHVGQSIVWRAVAHTNTAHGHWHVDVKGLDSTGIDCIFEKPQIYGGGLRAAAEWVQNVQLRGYEPSPEVVMERNAAATFEPLQTPLQRSIDRRILSARGGFDYAEMLEAYPLVQRQTVHARLIWLKSAGLLTAENGQLVKVPDYRNEWPRLIELLRRFKSRGAVVLGEPNRLMVATRNSGTEYGLITRIDRDEQNQVFAILETIKGAARAIPIAPGDIEVAETYLETSALVQSKGLELTTPSKTAEDLFRNLRAHGPVVDIIRGLTDADVSAPLTTPISDPRTRGSIRRNSRDQELGD